jgi:hypothetical protein
MCVTFWKLNSITLPFKYPIPCCEDAIDNFGNSAGANHDSPIGVLLDIIYGIHWPDAMLGGGGSMVGGVLFVFFVTILRPPGLAQLLAGSLLPEKGPVCPATSQQHCSAVATPLLLSSARCMQ